MVNLVEQVDLKACKCGNYIDPFKQWVTCPECREKSRNILRARRVKELANPAFICVECDFKTSNPAKEAKHKTTDRHIRLSQGLYSRKIYKCDKCDYSSKSWSNVARHGKIHIETAQAVAIDELETSLYSLLQEEKYPIESRNEELLAELTRRMDDSKQKLIDIHKELKPWYKNKKYR